MSQSVHGASKGKPPRKYWLCQGVPRWCCIQGKIDMLVYPCSPWVLKITYNTSSVDSFAFLHKLAVELEHLHQSNYLGQNSDAWGSIKQLFVWLCPPFFIPTCLCDTSEDVMCCFVGRGSTSSHLCDLKACDDSDESLSTAETFVLWQHKLSLAYSGLRFWVIDGPLLELHVKVFPTKWG